MSLIRGRLRRIGAISALEVVAVPGGEGPIAAQWLANGGGARYSTAGEGHAHEAPAWRAAGFRRRLSGGKQDMQQLDWYFDFISPYAYLGLMRLGELPDVAITYRPVLFAGLLNHWEQKGPAEIPPKRAWTYRSCTWTASRQGIRFRFPAAHPFNSLPYLRLAIAAGSTADAVHRIFEALWTTAADPADPSLIVELARSLAVDPADVSRQQFKDTLRSATEQAIARGVFGVPTLDVGGELFWGADATDFARAYLADPAILTTAEMQRVAKLPIGVSRIPV
ncbi:MAG: 2-hydroxychromene-2-carboxylate isomerase [Candidatus Accumulibacter sp.]|uniref:2-hydroxychromene-2-carboxylate isomerase n=1 Tax=Accumulibacter sp. TaxID=2053492 RepID=UPI0025EE516C|nr:2-hydroxychromene-2-carboxylate isomerase [Accumulibacter sp.]MCM8597795.1 2-hydroxychromene-2-carboxylate isomerase [Accumulibacter sp.]